MTYKELKEAEKKAIDEGDIKSAKEYSKQITEFNDRRVYGVKH